MSDLTQAWDNEQRVKSLKIVIQVGWNASGFLRANMHIFMQHSALK